MNISRILTELQAERERIEKAIAAIQALEKESAAPSAARAPGRPPAAKKAPGRKRRLSAEGRKRIAEAARRRWAAVHKAAAAKSAGSKGKSS
jgi:hypothetical protein